MHKSAPDMLSELLPAPPGFFDKTIQSQMSNVLTLFHRPMYDPNIPYQYVTMSQLLKTPLCSVCC